MSPIIGVRGIWWELTRHGRVTTRQGHSKLVRLRRSFPVEIARFGLGFRHQVALWAHSTATTLRLDPSPTGPAPSNAYQDRTPGRCERPGHRLLSIALEPEGITPHANVKPGAGSRG